MACSLRAILCKREKLHFVTCDYSSYHHMCVQGRSKQFSFGTTLAFLLF